MVQHGVLRNGDDYRDFWIPAADKHNVLIVAPTFSNDIWPGVESYNNGRVFSAGGNPRHIDGWTYALVAKVFARSEEHTSELQSLMRNSYAVFCLQKNNTKYNKLLEPNTYA